MKISRRSEEPSLRGIPSQKTESELGGRPIGATCSVKAPPNPCTWLGVGSATMRSSEVQMGFSICCHAYGVVYLTGPCCCCFPDCGYGQSKGSSDISSSSDEDHCSSIRNIISSRTTTTNEDDCSSSQLS